MNKLALLAAAAFIATAGAASATDFKSGNFAITQTITSVSDVTGVGAICAGFQQVVGAKTHGFLSYLPPVAPKAAVPPSKRNPSGTPAVPGVDGSALLLSYSTNIGGAIGEYIIAENVPMSSGGLVNYAAPAASVTSVTFPYGVAVPGGSVASITLKFTSTTAVTETISVGTASCTVTQTLAKAGPF